jgi:DNA invertase Pin-like site-specific DNA recombinase
MFYGATPMESYIAYYRVSTSKQARSGLGLAAQRELVRRFIAGGSRELVAEYEEVQSGRKDRRQELWNAIAEAKKRSAKLIIARLDRFSRRVSFIAGILEQGIGLTVAEMPNATDFQLHIFAALAQEERRLISERTRTALAQAKKRNVVLGKNGTSLAEANRRRADEFAAGLISVICGIGFDKSYQQIALRLNALGYRTAKGKLFAPQTVKNVISRFNAL